MQFRMGYLYLYVTVNSADMYIISVEYCTVQCTSRIGVECNQLWLKGIIAGERVYIKFGYS